MVFVCCRRNWNLWWTFFTCLDFFFPFLLHPIICSSIPPLYCSLYSLTLGVGKPTLHMDDLPGGSNILEIKIFGPQQIYFTSRVRMLTRAGALEIGRLAAPRNWAWPPGWWLTSALPGPGQSKWSQFTQDLHHCKYLNIKWGGELNDGMAATVITMFAERDDGCH